MIFFAYTSYGQTAEEYFQRGGVKIGSKDYEGALIEFNNGIKLNPNYPKAYNTRGLIKYMLKDFKGAMVDFDKTIELDPEYSDAYKNRGMIKNKNGEYYLAILDFDKALKLVLLPFVWIEIQSTMEKQYCTSEIFKCSIPSTT